MTPRHARHDRDWGLTLYLIGCMVPGVAVFAWMFA